MDKYPFCYLAVYGPINGYAVIQRQKALEIVEQSIIYRKFPPLPPSKKKPKVIYAENRHFYLLNLGNPDDGPRLPTWREFFEFYCIDWSDPDLRAKFLKMNNLCNPYCGEPEPKINLEREIHGDIMDIYRDHDFEHFLNPAAVGFRYLLTAQIFHWKKLPKGEVVGEIHMFQKNEIHPDVPQAWAINYESLACLQYCLIRGGENIRVEVLGSKSL